MIKSSKQSGFHLLPCRSLEKQWWYKDRIYDAFTKWSWAFKFLMVLLSRFPHIPNTRHNKRSSNRKTMAYVMRLKKGIASSLCAGSSSSCLYVQHAVEATAAAFYTLLISFYGHIFLKWLSIASMKIGMTQCSRHERDSLRYCRLLH